MEDNANFTYTYEKEDTDKPERRLKVIFAGVIAALAVLAVVLGIFFGIRSGSSDDKTPTTTEPLSTEQQSTTQPAPKSPYNPGLYAVNTDGMSLFFRKDHSKDAETILEIADKTELTIDDVYFDETAESEDYMYWGKTSFKGHTGWVAMKYMKKAYSDNVITPDDISTTLPILTEETSTAAEETSAVPQTTTAGEEQPATAETTTQAPSKYSAGDYTVSVGGSTLTMRKGAGTDNETIISIPDGEKLSVTEVVDTGSSNETTRYWGKVTYKGHTGYVCMTYLKK